jgi:hypothetical protein
LQAGEILSSSGPNKKCRASIENEMRDIMEKASPNIEKSHQIYGIEKSH